MNKKVFIQVLHFEISSWITYGFLFNEYRIGLKTDPCETPNWRSLTCDFTPSIITYCFPLWRLGSNHSKTCPLEPRRLHSLSKKSLCSTVSNALDMSNRRSATHLLPSIAQRISFCTFTKAVSVLCRCLYADWRDSSRSWSCSQILN